MSANHLALISPAIGTASRLALRAVRTALAGWCCALGIVAALPAGAADDAAAADAAPLEEAQTLNWSNYGVLEIRQPVPPGAAGQPITWRFSRYPTGEELGEIRSGDAIKKRFFGNLNTTPELELYEGTAQVSATQNTGMDPEFNTIRMDKSLFQVAQGALSGGPDSIKSGCTDVDHLTEFYKKRYLVRGCRVRADAVTLTVQPVDQPGVAVNEILWSAGPPAALPDDFDVSSWRASDGTSYATLGAARRHFTWTGPVPQTAPMSASMRAFLRQQRVLMAQPKLTTLAIRSRMGLTTPVSCYEWGPRQLKCALREGALPRINKAINSLDVSSDLAGPRQRSWRTDWYVQFDIEKECVTIRDVSLALGHRFVEKYVMGDSFGMWGNTEAERLLQQKLAPTYYTYQDTRVARRRRTIDVETTQGCMYMLSFTHSEFSRGVPEKRRPAGTVLPRWR